MLVDAISFLKKMENILQIWIEDQFQKRAPLSWLAIRNKALQLYKNLHQP